MRLPFGIWVLAVISLLSTVGLGVVAPALPALADEFGVGITAMSVAVSGFAAARLITNLCLTAVLRHTPLRRVLALGLGFQALTTILAGLAQDYVTFIVFRCLSGVGSAAFTVSATALLVALAPADRRGRAMSVYGGAAGVGAVMGPAVGGALALADPHLPLIVYGIGLGLAAIVTVVLLRKAGDVRTSDGAPDQPGPEPGRAGRGAFVTVFRDPMFVAVLGCQLVVGWIYYGLPLGILPMVLEALGYSLAFLGIALAVYAAMELVGVSFGGPLSDRLGRFRVLLASLALGFCALCLFQFAALPTMVVLAFVVLGLAAGSQTSVAAAMLADTPVGRTAAAAGLFWITFDVAAIVGPFTTGLIAELLGPEWALAASLAVLTVPLALALRARNRSATGAAPVSD